MIESWFNALSLALNGRFEIALFAAFGWGVLSILLSPCHLSSIPLVIGYITSQGKVSLRRSFGLSLVFAVGILLTIALVGVVTAATGRLLGDVGIWGNILVAAVFIVLGLYLMDLIDIPWNVLPFNPKKINRWGGAFLLGLVFGLGLGPCTFAYLAPVLGVVFQIAATQMGKALLLITAFGLGHCTIIVLAGSATQTVQKYLNWSEESKATLYVKRTSGALVVLGGAYFIFTLF